MYPVLTYNETQLRNSLTSLVLFAQNIEHNNFKFILDFCKKSIVSLANQSSVIRCLKTEAKDKDLLVEFYNEIECHTDVMNMLNRISMDWEEDPYFRREDFGFNIVVYTYSVITTGFETYED